MKYIRWLSAFRTSMNIFFRTDIPTDFFVYSLLFKTFRSFIRSFESQDYLINVELKRAMHHRFESNSEATKASRQCGAMNEFLSNVSIVYVQHL